MHDYILKMHCPDRPGILATVTQELDCQDGDVRDAQSFGDESTGEFFVRMHLRFPDVDKAGAFSDSISKIAGKLGIWFAVNDLSRVPRMLILVSRHDHCLIDLLHRVRSGSLRAEIPVIVSNHDDVRRLVDWHRIPFLHLPVDTDTRSAQEKQILDLVAEHQVDLVVLARYMQILSANLCRELEGRCINIHHSFLPSFKGASPYRQAHNRGVKIIGATAHYVTDDLDEGPIIEQDVRRVDHGTSVAEMTAIGKETEASVLARAVRWHLEHRILMNGSKTVVFA